MKVAGGTMTCSVVSRPLVGCIHLHRAGNQDVKKVRQLPFADENHMRRKNVQHGGIHERTKVFGFPHLREKVQVADDLLIGNAHGWSALIIRPIDKCQLRGLPINRNNGPGQQQEPRMANAVRPGSAQSPSFALSCGIERKCPPGARQTTYERIVLRPP